MSVAVAWTAGVPAAPVVRSRPLGVSRARIGAVGTPAVRAAATLTLALPKVGLLDAPNVGELYLADISVPPLVYRRMGIPVPELFRQSSLLRIGPWPPSDPPGLKA